MRRLSAKVFGGADGQELLQEDLRIEHSDVSRSADESVGIRAERVEYVIANDSCARGFENALKNVGHHLHVDRA